MKFWGERNKGQPVCSKKRLTLGTLRSHAENESLTESGNDVTVTSTSGCLLALTYENEAVTASCAGVYPLADAREVTLSP